MVTIKDNRRVIDEWEAIESRLLPFDYLLGKTIDMIEILKDASIKKESHPECDLYVYTVERDKGDRDAMIFHLSDGTQLLFYHGQQCCETVTIDSIVGDLEDLIGSPILLAEDVYHRGEPSDSVRPRDDEGDIDHGEAQPLSNFTWTFYKLATAKGYVDIRWFGGSESGFYSESADLVNMTPLTQEEINAH